MRIASSNDLCRLINATSLEEWIDSLPEEKQYCVCRTLEVSSEDKKPPVEYDDLNQFFHTLKAEGERDAAVTELKKFAALKPTNGSVFACLGWAYNYAEKPAQALACYLNANKLGFTEFWIFGDIAGSYYCGDDYSLATHWYQKATECKPDWAKAYFWLGCSPNKQGNLREAHAAWIRVLDLEDEEFTSLAHEAIEECPYETLELHV